MVTQNSKMSAPLLKFLRIHKLMKTDILRPSRQQLQRCSAFRWFTDNRSQNNNLALDENESNNSLNVNLADIFAETDDIEGDTDLKHTSEEKSSYVKAFEKLEKIQRGEVPKPEPSNKSFATLLRESKLMQLGEFTGSVLVGEVFDVHGDDLYIDFGGKFHCVCPKPHLIPWKYVRGSKVKVHIHTMEMSSKFVGSTEHVTLLEADATLLGLYDSDMENKDPTQDANIS